MKNLNGLFMCFMMTISAVATVKAQTTDSNVVMIISASVNTENKAELPVYLGSMMEVFRANGGTPIGRYKIISKLTDEGSPDLIAIISFPDSEVIQDMLKSDEYKKLEQLRDRVFEKLNMMLTKQL
ncbi:MAG: DUF1330 domain-containing protein [Reichenbachiella sp.]|uniref:DUF1330 domain-containing protein n=1 Tax=Reichenbachiella sp. TaxID=2184521 RepID=UPI003266D9C2